MHAIDSGADASSAVAAPPASLPSPVLARRLADLCGHERNVQVDFLLHLAVFDERRAWAEAGYGSLWSYCLEVLHLREGAAWRRIEAMKALRRFPALEGPLREGRLCLTTVNLLAPVLTDENLEELVGRAAFLSKADTERLVVSIRPRVAPKDGIRRVGTSAAPRDAVPVESAPTSRAAGTLALDGVASPALGLGDPALERTTPGAPVVVGTPPTRPELRPVSADAWSLRVTLDEACKAELDELVRLLSHKTRGDLAATLREAIRCALARHGKRKGAVEPERRRAAAAEASGSTAAAGSGGTAAAGPAAGDGSPARAADPRAIPIEVKREVWKRDGGRCAWTSADGKRCGSRWRLEFGHVRPVALGGKATVANIRVECGVHNGYEAVRMFGPEHMARCRRPLPPAEVT